MAALNLEETLDRLLGPNTGDLPLEERREVALQEYGVPDAVLTRQEVADLPVVDCTTKTLGRWEDDADEDDPLFPGAIDHGRQTKYPPQSILGFLARRVRRGAVESDEQGADGAENEEQQGAEPRSDRPEADGPHESNGNGRLDLENLPDNWEDARNEQQ